MVGQKECPMMTEVAVEVLQAARKRQGLSANQQKLGQGKEVFFLQFSEETWPS